MANVNFRPNKGKTVNDPTKPQKIYIRYRIGAKVDFNASTGASVLIENWDFEKQRVKNRSHVTDRNEINARLTNLTKKFEDFEAQNLKDGFTPTYEMVKTFFDSCFTTEQEPTTARPITFFEFVDSFIEDAKTKPNRHTKNQTPVTKGTITGYLTALNLFKRYNDEVQKFDFEDIDLHFYNKFSNWCDELGFRKGYKGKNIKTLKVFMNAAVRAGITTNEKFRDSDFMVVHETADSIYLNLDELTAIWQLDLTNDPTKERARDLFLIGCFTGLRVSDYNNLKPSSIKEVNGVKMFVVKTQKTKKTVAIPMHPIVNAILTKYDGIPARMYDQKINVNIKEVARMASIDEVIETTATIGGLEVTQMQPKFKLVSTHTARRSFCTNAYLNDMDSLDIMAISGHTSDKDFLKYIKVTPEQRAVKMSKSKFFTNATALKVG
jgi:integrase